MRDDGKVRFRSIIETIPANVIGSRPISADQVRPIMRRSSWFDEKQALAVLRDQEEMQQHFISSLRKGDRMIKYDTKGKSTHRHFRITKDGTELKWSKFNGVPKISKIELATVVQIVIGPRTQIFRTAQYDWKTQKPWNCFSLVTRERSLDIECLSRDQYVTWILGLQSLVPLTFRLHSRATIHWHRALFKTVQIAQNTLLPVSEVWHVIVDDAKGRNRQDEKSTVVKSFIESGPAFLLESNDSQ